MLSAVRRRRLPDADRAPQAARNSNVRLLLVVFGLVILSRVGYQIAGVRFDASSLPWFWQYVDPVLLRFNLAESLWYLHSQPPAFNAFLGVVVGLFTGREALVFSIFYLFVGIGLLSGFVILLAERSGIIKRAGVAKNRSGKTGKSADPEHG